MGDINKLFGTIKAPLDTGRKPGTLSVCIITRNQGLRIKRLIASCKHFADEVIVVDTGSVDGSQHVVRPAGGVLVETTWDDDFSRARNIALDHATSQWIVWLDSDDEISPNEYPNLKRLKTAATDRIFGFVVLNTQKDSNIGSSFAQIRMFPNHPEIRFERAVHEQVMPSCARLGLHCKYVPLQVVHRGYEDKKEQRRKARRNILIAFEKETKLIGKDPAFTLALAESHLVLGEYNEAIYCLNKVRNIPNCRDIHRDVYASALIHIGEIHCLNEKFYQARDTFLKALLFSPGNLSVLYNLAMAYERIGDTENKIECYEKIINIKEQKLSSCSVSFDPIMMYSFFKLVKLHIKAGDKAAAKKVLEESFKRYPNVKELRGLYNSLA